MVVKVWKKKGLILMFLKYFENALERPVSFVFLK